MERVSSRTQKMVLSAILSAITVVLGITQIGFIPVGPIRATILHIPVIIGAIFGGPIVGSVVGLSFGVMSFLQAPTDPTFAPIWAIGGFREIVLIAVTAIIPRVLVGLVSAYVYKATNKIERKTSVILLFGVQIFAFLFNAYQMIDNIRNQQAYWVNIVIAVAILVLLFVITKNYQKYNMQAVVTAVAGTLTNTVLFIFFAYQFFKYDFATAFNIDVGTVKDLWLTAGVTNGLPELLVSIVLVNYISIALFAFKKRN
ncbi:MAG: ECF transporter S component [Clostridia bacterium]|nr:ECF transporter S component [Clostridia bacterium]